MERPVDIKSITLLDFSSPYLTFKVAVSGGTYIRSLVHDLGQKLGCGATLIGLERTAIGPYRIENSLTLSEIEQKKKSKKLEKEMISVEKALEQLPGIKVKESFSKKITDGLELRVKDIDSVEKEFELNTTVALKDSLGEIMAIGKSLVSSTDFTNKDLKGKIFFYRRVII
jgi:tRNA U55 pseudouridine synthase TruB